MELQFRIRNLFIRVQQDSFILGADSYQLLPLATKMDQVGFKNNWNILEPSAYNSNDAPVI